MIGNGIKTDTQDITKEVNLVITNTTVINGTVLLGTGRTDTDGTSEVKVVTDTLADTKVAVLDVIAEVQIAIAVLIGQTGEVLPLVINHSHSRTK